MESSGFALRYLGKWVLSASVGGTGGFSAPTVTHLTSESAHGPQNFLPHDEPLPKAPTTPTANFPQ